MVLVVVDAVIGVVNPLILRVIIDQGILHKKIGLIEGLAFLAAGLAVLDAALGLARTSGCLRVVGEGLIYDMRARVFAHVQSMPIAFFTRTQTGALVTRLNNDVLGAQQAFTDILSSVVSNFVSVVLVLAAMLFLSWKITLVALVILPVFVVPARRIGRKLGGIVKESYALNAVMNTTMTERFNVAGALLVKLFGHPETESAPNSTPRAGRVRDIGVSQAMYGRVFFTSLTLTASLCDRARLRLGRCSSRARHSRDRNRRRTHRLPEPPLRAVDGPFERERRRHDRTRVVPAGVRGARSGADDQREARTLSRSRADRRRSSSTTSTSATRPPRRSLWRRSSRSQCSSRLRSTRFSTTSRFVQSPASLSRWWDLREPARPP